MGLPGTLMGRGHGARGQERGRVIKQKWVVSTQLGYSDF